MKHLKKLIAPAILAGAVTIGGPTPAHAGVACLNSSAACAAILDYLLESTGNDVGTTYTALKNQFNTRACPFGSSQTGLYTYYAHGHGLEDTSVVAIKQTGVTCFVCEAVTQFSANKIDGYAGVCEPTTARGWTFSSRDCGEEFDVSLDRVTFDVNWCAENRGETLDTPTNPGGTMAACKTGVPCLR